MVPLQAVPSDSFGSFSPHPMETSMKNCVLSHVYGGETAARPVARLLLLRRWRPDEHYHAFSLMPHAPYSLD